MNPISLKIKIVTSHFEETISWYRDLLHLQVIEEWNEPGDEGCILGLGGPVHEALLEIYHGRQLPDFSGLSLQFRVADVDRFPIPNDIRFVADGPEDRPWGSRYRFLTDPNGISVVIFSGTSH